MSKEKIDNKDIIYIAQIHWDYLFQRPQQIVLRLAKRNRILYVEPVGTIFSWVASNLGLTKMKKHNIGGGLTKKSDSLYIYSLPEIFLPFFKGVRIINRINNSLLSLLIKRVTNKLEFRVGVLWLNFPTGVDLIDKVKSGLVCYDCMDEHIYFVNRLVRRSLSQMEREIVQKADVVFSSSERIFQRLKKINRRVYIIPNGVDIEHFKKTSLVTAKPKELQDVSKPIVGFVGVVQKWIDLDLLAKVTNSVGCYMIIIGPVEINISKYREIKNMRFLGKIDYGNLPNYIRWFDVAVFPFKVNELTQGVNPVKIYEYLAAGKLVVSVDLPEIRKLKDVCFISKDDDEFIENIKKAIKLSNSKEMANRIEKGLEIAEQNSWNERIIKIERILRLVNSQN